MGVRSRVLIAYSDFPPCPLLVPGHCLSHFPRFPALPALGAWPPSAPYQHNAAVKALAKELEITLLFLPSYSPNLNLIERLWKFTKRRALYGRYHPTFHEFRAAIQETLDGIPTIHAE